MNERLGIKIFKFNMFITKAEWRLITHGGHTFFVACIYIVICHWNGAVDIKELFFDFECMHFY